MIRAVGINTKQNNQENNKIFVLGGCKARGIPKGGFGRVLAIKAKKGEKFSSAASTGLNHNKNYYRNLFLFLINIHSLRVGWTIFFSSYSVVSVFGSGGK